jgi:hypothetical protein
MPHPQCYASPARKRQSGSDRYSTIKQLADIYSFLFAELDMPVNAKK